MHDDAEHETQICVLLIEDEAEYASDLRRGLEARGFRVEWEWHAARAIEAVSMLRPDVILLDLILPDAPKRGPELGGEQVAFDLHRTYPSIPILILTGAPDDRILWDRLNEAKPANFIPKSCPTARLDFLVRLAYREAVARNKLEGLAGRGGPQRLRVGELEIDLDEERITHGTHEIRLTATQYRLFALLARNLGYWVKNDVIIERVWGEGYVGEAAMGNLYTQMGLIRQKLEDGDPRARYIENRPGWGYRLRDPGPLSDRSQQDDDQDDDDQDDGL